MAKGPFKINEVATHAYLQAFREMALPETEGLSPEYRALIQHLKTIQTGIDSPNGTSPQMYRKLHELAEKIPVQSPAQVPDSAREFHKQFFMALYENDNKIPDKISEHLIHPETSIKSHKPKKHDIIGYLLDKKVDKPGILQMRHPENPFNKFFSGVLGIRYNPLKKTNIPYVAADHGEGESAFKVLRFGAQVQGMHQTQPAFENYLAVKKAQDPFKNHYHHVYFNLLKRNDKNFEAKQENKRTKALETMNDKSILGVAVITLPADNPFFFEGYDKKSGKSKHNEPVSRDAILKVLQDSIRNNDNDFYIPKEIKEKLFGNNLENLDGKIEELFDKSWQATLGSQAIDSCTAEERQAVVFDFVKFQLSDHIIKELQPSTVNFSCKDAIDRGGVHALWYEFQKRIDEGSPMKQQEFEKYLDASPLLVKERPMNDHRNVIWTAMKEQYFANPSKFESNSHLNWVPAWLAKNYPHDKKVDEKVQIDAFQAFAQSLKEVREVHKKNDMEVPVVKAEEAVVVEMRASPQWVPGRTLSQVQPVNMAVTLESLGIDRFNSIQSGFLKAVQDKGSTVTTKGDEAGFNRSYEITDKDNMRFDYEVKSNGDDIQMGFSRAPWSNPDGAEKAIQILADQAEAYFKETGQQPSIAVADDSPRNMALAARLETELEKRGMQPVKPESTKRTPNLS